MALVKESNDGSAAIEAGMPCETTRTDPWAISVIDVEGMPELL
jgi:hypothetical protein